MEDNSSSSSSSSKKSSHSNNSGGSSSNSSSDSGGNTQWPEVPNTVKKTTTLHNQLLSSKSKLLIFLNKITLTYENLLFDAG